MVVQERDSKKQNWFLKIPLNTICVNLVTFDNWSVLLLLQQQQQQSLFVLTLALKQIPTWKYWK